MITLETNKEQVIGKYNSFKEAKKDQAYYYLEYKARLKIKYNGKVVK